MTMIHSGALWGHLHYLQFGAPDPAKLAQFAYRALQMTVQQSGEDWICCARDRVLVYSPGPARTLLSAGYAVAEPGRLAALKTRLVQHGVVLEPTPLDFFEDDAVTFRDPDGNRMSFGRPIHRSATAESLPARLQHLVLASTDAERMTRFYTDVVGLRLSDRVLDQQHALRTSFMRTDDEHHSFAVFRAPAARLDHFSLETDRWDDIRDWADHFARTEVPIFWGPGRHGPGNNLFIMVNDPDGNAIEFSAEITHHPYPMPPGEWPHAPRTINLWGSAIMRS